MLALQVAALAAMLTLATASVGHGDATDPSNPGKCWVQQAKIWMPEGSHIYLPECVEVSCSKNGDKMYLYYFSCGLVGKAPGCTLRSDMSKAHPDCCPTNVCPN